MIEQMTYAAPIPLDEDERLSRLRSLKVLDTEAEPIFDAIARMASSVCGVPIALLSLVDSDRQWFKSNVGLPGATQTPREVAFCAHAILRPELMEVPDAMQDPRFSTNPLVTGQPHIRFYAGAPIVMPGGESIGTLCVIDRQARVLTDYQRAALTDLALVAAQALDMRQGALERDRLNALAVQQAQEISTKAAIYHAIVEDQSDLVSLALPTGELTFVNQAYARHFGLTPASMQGHNLLEYVAANDRDSVAAHLQALCREPGTAHGENRMYSVAGNECWVAWTNRAMGDANGKVIALHSVGRDITDRKRTERALLASQNNFRALYEATPAMLHSIDPQGRILFVSDAWLANLGYARDEVVGVSSADFLTSASREYARSVVIPNFLQSGRCDDIPYQMVRKDGSVIDVLLSAVLQRNSEGQPAHSLAVIQDVTEKNALSAALRVNQERLSLASSANGIGIWEVDLATGRLEWSDTMFDIFGGSRATFGGTLEDWSRKLHPADLEACTRAFDWAIAAHASMDFDFRVLRDDGEVRHVNARAMVIEDAQGKAVRVLGTNYDISERKKIEQALEYSEQRLRLIANNLPILISHIDTDYRYTFTNDKYQAWFSLGESGTVGKTVTEVFGATAFAHVKPHLDQALAGKDVSFELRSSVPNSPTHMFVHYVPDRDAQGVVKGVFGMVRDRTEQHQARARLQASERQLRAVTDNLPVVITYIDTEERFRYLNETFHDWLGVNLDWAIHRQVAEVVGPVLYAQRRAYLHRALEGERVEFDVESMMQGQRRHLRVSYIPDVWTDGIVHGIFTLSNDVTAFKEIEQALQDMARVDVLTGLPNRRQFNERMPEVLARAARTGAAIALMFLDVDFFKSINDTLGHGAGDKVLKEFADRLVAGVRATDMVARLGGDEFVIVLEHLDGEAEARGVAQKIVEQVRSPLFLGAQKLKVTTSVGIAYQAKTTVIHSAHRLVSTADHALYAAKAAGRDTFQLVVLGPEGEAA